MSDEPKVIHVDISQSIAADIEAAAADLSARIEASVLATFNCYPYGDAHYELAKDSWTYVEMIFDSAVDPDRYQVRRTEADGTVTVTWQPFNAPVCATQTTAPAAPAPLTEDEAIDAAIAGANQNTTMPTRATLEYLGETTDPRFPESSPGFRYCISADANATAFDRVIGRYSPATGQYERTVPYASPKPLFTNPWQLPNPDPDDTPAKLHGARAVILEKDCYYCGHPYGSHAPACIEVKYGHADEVLPPPGHPRKGP